MRRKKKKNMYDQEHEHISYIQIDRRISSNKLDIVLYHNDKEF